MHPFHSVNYKIRKPGHEDSLRKTFFGYHNLHVVSLFKLNPFQALSPNGSELYAKFLWC